MFYRIVLLLEPKKQTCRTCTGGCIPTSWVAFPHPPSAPSAPSHGKPGGHHRPLPPSRQLLKVFSQYYQAQPEGRRSSNIQDLPWLGGTKRVTVSLSLIHSSFGKTSEVHRMGTSLPGGSAPIRRPFCTIILAGEDGWLCVQDLLLVIGPKPDEGGVELGGGGGQVAQPLHQHNQQAQHQPWAGHRKMVVSKNDWVSTRAPGQRQGTRQLSNPRRGCPLLSSGTSCRGNEREMMFCIQPTD